MMYYFGCWQQAGHYLHDPTGRNVQTAGPFTLAIDSYFTPTTRDIRHGRGANSLTYQDDSIASLTRCQGWTILAMWDRSVDSRHGSNAAFLIEGHFDTDTMWQLARQYYPHVVERLKAAPLPLKEMPIV